MAHMLFIPFPLFGRERERKGNSVCASPPSGGLFWTLKNKTLCVPISTRKHTHTHSSSSFFLLPARALDSTLRRKGRKKGVVSAFADAALIPLATLETSERAHTHTQYGDSCPQTYPLRQNTHAHDLLFYLYSTFFFCLLHNFQVKMQSALHAIQLIATFIFCFVPLRVKS